MMSGETNAELTWTLFVFAICDSDPVIIIIQNLAIQINYS